MAREITDKTFLEELKIGNLSKLLGELRKNENIDIQIRDNYLSVYYRGGSLLKIQGKNSFVFDEFYFYTESDRTSKEIKKDIKLCTELKEQKDNLLKKIKEGKHQEFIEQATNQINEWLKAHNKENSEREEQHKLLFENQYSKSDYTIIDIEFQVSVNSDYKCTYPREKPKKPRFDIIAVNKNGRLCVIELKKGLGALGGTSGLKEHWECYKASIGRKPQIFRKEMVELLEQKQEFKLISKDLRINNEDPEFIFAYSYDTEKKNFEKQREIFENKAKNIDKNIQCIIIDSDHKLKNL
ncbi:MAG: hypothetical protein FWD09_04815 [Lentimicrobiaceae bacterium]|nr:hypothetical protein [Lentimicrobiaceae bacterium]